MAIALIAVAAIAALVALAYFQSQERQAEATRHAAERRELYTRIQSPELAPVIAHSTGDVLLDPKTNQSVKFDDDKDFYDKTQEG